MAVTHNRLLCNLKGVMAVTHNRFIVQSERHHHSDARVSVPDDKRMP